ncbi:MAG: hypothetical protein AB1486_10515 [Planctomycetota bacterium]
MGEIWIVDGNTMEATPYRPSYPYNLLLFGRAVHLMRDYSDPPDGYVEILVGSDSWEGGGDSGPTGGWGVGFVVDHRWPAPIFAFSPPDTSKAARFSSTLDFIADILRERAPSGNEFGPEDPADRRDEVLIGDGLYQSGGFPDAGFAGMYRGQPNYSWRLVEDIPNGEQGGTTPGQYLGNYVLALGDADNSRHLDGALVHGSWDYGVAEGYDAFTIWPSGDAGDTQFKTEQRFELAGSLFPGWNKAANDVTYPTELTSVADINLDGYDDFAIVVKTNDAPEAHAVRIYSGAPWDPDPVTLWQLDTYQNKPLMGTPGPRRTSVNRLGDVNGDGADDWGIVTGIDDGSDGVPDRAVAAIYGPMLGPIEQPGPPTPLGTPRLFGNRIVEIGRQLFIHITNGIQGQTVSLFRDTQLLSQPVIECNGERWIADPPVATYTYDGNGEAFHFEPVPYDPSLIGTKIYFQARSEVYGLYPCALSKVREVRREDRTDPDDT